MDIAYVLELLHKEFNVDENQFQQIIGDGICSVSSTFHFLIGLLGEICLRKFIVTQGYCLSNHSSICPVESCKFHLVLIGSSLDQILQRLDKYHFTYQIVDSIYTINKHNFFSSKGEVFNQLNHAVELNLNCRLSEKLASVAKKRLLREKLKRHHLNSAQKLAANQTLASAFLERIRKVQNSKYESDLLKTVDCFLDGYDSVNIFFY